MLPQILTQPLHGRSVFEHTARTAQNPLAPMFNAEHCTGTCIYFALPGRPALLSDNLSQSAFALLYTLHAQTECLVKAAALYIAAEALPRPLSPEWRLCTTFSTACD